MGESARKTELYVKGNSPVKQLEQDESNTTRSRLHTIYELKTERAIDIPEMTKTLQNTFLITFLITAGIIITTSSGSPMLGFYIKLPFNEKLLHFVLATVAVVYGGRFFYEASLQAIRKRTANPALPISITVLIAYIYSVVVTFKGGESLYGAVSLILTMVLLGYWIETIVWGEITESIQSFFGNKPKMVNLMKDRLPTVVPIGKVQVGDILLVRPGERVPVDGVLIDGRGLVDESPINSDPDPKSKGVGDFVVGGSKNQEGTFHMRVIRVGSYSTMDQMVKLVEGAQRTPMQLQNRIENLLPVFILIDLAIGLVAFLAWYLVFGYGLAFSLTVAIAVVVATGLDALTLAAPVVVTIGAGIGLTHGILIKDAAAIEKAAQIETVVFDKISCLTEGDPYVSDIIQFGKLTKPGLLRLAASIEKNSEDPIARAVVKETEVQVGIGIPNPKNYRRIRGKGAMGELETRTIVVGNEHMMRDSGINIADIEERAEELTRKGKTVVYVAVDGLIEGILGISDKLRMGTKEAIKKLHDAEIEVAMITSDDYKTATGIAAELDIDKVYANTAPEDRAVKLEEIQRQGLYVAAVGNGVNDADLLDKAYLGIAVTDSLNLNLKSGSIILARNDPFDVINAVTLSKFTVGKVKQNIGWVIGYNVLAILIAFGILYPLAKFLLGPGLAAIAMSASTLLVMGNSLLLKRKILNLKRGDS